MRVRVERGTLLLVLQAALEVLGAAFFVAAGVLFVAAALFDLAAFVLAGFSAGFAEGFADCTVCFSFLLGFFDARLDFLAEGFAGVFEELFVSFEGFGVVGVGGGHGEVLGAELAAEFANGFVEVVFFVGVGAEGVDETADFVEGGVVEVFG